MKQVIIIADNKVNTIKAEKAGPYVRVFDLYDEEFLMDVKDFNDPDHLRYTISHFHGMENIYPHPETFDHDGLYGA